MGRYFSIKESSYLYKKQSYANIFLNKILKSVTFIELN